MKLAVKFKQIGVVPRQVGELVRFKVIQGPDKGSVFVVTGSRATIGRGEENDITVGDLKASRAHVEISLSGAGWTFRDMGSANGMYHNGKALRGGSLSTGDIIQIGETQFEFLSSDAGTRFLTAPPGQGVSGGIPLKTTQAPASASQNRTNSASKSGQPKLIFIVLVLVAAALLFSGEEKKKKRNVQRAPAAPLAPGTTESLENYLPVTQAGTNHNAEMFFKSGFREYRERNYLRAKMLFDTTLQLVPGHHLATVYSENCEKAIKDEVKFHMTNGKLSMDSGKLVEAQGHYEAVLRLLFRERSNPDYKEAMEQRDAVMKVRKENGSS